MPVPQVTEHCKINDCKIVTVRVRDTHGTLNLNFTTSKDRRMAYFRPVGHDPLRWALLLGAGLLACRALGRAKGVRQFQDAAICQPLFAQDLSRLKSTTTAPGALQGQK